MKFKVGDRVIWNDEGKIRKGTIVEIISINSEFYPIKIKFNCLGFTITFTKEGKFYFGDENPIVLFHDLSTKVNKLLTI